MVKHSLLIQELNYSEKDWKDDGRDHRQRFHIEAGLAEEDPLGDILTQHISIEEAPQGQMDEID